jgi:hypothetical protein
LRIVHHERPVLPESLPLLRAQDHSLRRPGSPSAPIASALGRLDFSIMPIKNVVFFLEQPFTKRNYDRFGIEILTANGFDVSVVDFTPLLHPAVAQSTKSLAYREFGSVHPITTREEARRAVSRFTPDDTFVINLLGYNAATFCIYRQLTQRGMRYAVHVSGAMPDPHAEQLPLLKRMRSFWKSLRHSPTKTGYLKSIITSIPFRLRAKSVKGATWWLAGGSESPKGYALPFDADTRVLFIHSMDYDVYLKTREKTISATKTAVFLDQYLPFHPDRLYFLVNYPVTPEEYYPKLRALFLHLKERCGLDTVIAAHPKSDYELHEECFAGFDVVRDRTADLIRSSKLVIAHGTTAVSLAVLFRKPILFVTTNQLERSAIRDHIHTLAAWLGKGVVNIDEPLDAIDLTAESEVNEERYRYYQNCYIVKDGTPELPFWQIVADELRTL